MFKSITQKTITAVLLSLLMQNTVLPAKAVCSAEKSINSASAVQQKILTVKNLDVSAVSVSCLKVTWTAEKNRDYTVTVEALAPDYAYIDNAYFVFHGNDTCYLTGLRENNEYKITVEPVLKTDEKYTVKPISKNCRTEKVEVIEEFPHEDGLTNAMSYERAGGLTRQPSSQLPMIPEEWQFKITEKTREQYDILNKLIHSPDVTEIICATDADREGECIFRYVRMMTKCYQSVRRLWVSSLEESAVRSALNRMKPLSDYNELFQAGFCRARADWLVGMNGSRLFSCRYKGQLNIGRVQTPTLAMVVQRDHDAENFVKQKVTIQSPKNSTMLKVKKEDKKKSSNCR